MMSLDEVTTWRQGAFIDGPEYREQTAAWKNARHREEALLVRPGPKDNAICTAQTPELAAWIAKRLNLAARYEEKFGPIDE